MGHLPARLPLFLRKQLVLGGGAVRAGGTDRPSPATQCTATQLPGSSLNFICSRFSQSSTTWSGGAEPSSKGQSWEGNNIVSVNHMRCACGYTDTSWTVASLKKIFYFIIYQKKKNAVSHSAIVSSSDKNVLRWLPKC